MPIKACGNPKGKGKKSANAVRDAPAANVTNPDMDIDADAQGSEENTSAPVAMQRAIVLAESTIQSFQHAFKASAALHQAAGPASHAHPAMPNDHPRVLLDPGASYQVVRLDAKSTGGTYDRWLQMAAGKRSCRTAINEKRTPTLYIPMSRTELDHAQSDDSIFSVWWLVIRGSWWIWTPTHCIMVTRHGRTLHLNI